MVSERMVSERTKALDAAISQIEKQFGKGSVMRMGDVGAVRDVEAVSSGSLGLDIALGVGGLPRGRVVEIYGPESSGKTTLALHAVAEVQKGKKFAQTTEAAVRTFLADTDKGKKTEKDVNKRIHEVRRETDENILFETRDRAQKGAVLRRSHSKK